MSKSLSLKPFDTEQLHFYLFIPFLLTFPFDKFAGVSNVTFIVLGVNWLFFGAWQAKWQRLKQSTWVLPFIIFYLLHLIGFLYSNNIQDASFDLKQKLPILLFPLIMASFPHFSELRLRVLMWVFISAMTIYAFLCLGNSLWANYQDNALNTLEMRYYTYQNLSGLYEMDAVFMAMYSCLALYFLLFLTISDFKHYTSWQKLALFIWMIFLFSIIMLLTSRMQIIILFSTAFVGVLYFSYSQGKVWLGIAGVVVMGLIGVTIIWSNPLIKQRFSKIFDSQNQIILDKKEDRSLGKIWDGATLRRAQWQCAADLIQRHWLVGVGNGDTQDELQKTYEEFKFYFASRYNRYNAHSQYLETWIGLGIFGLFSLLLMYFMPLMFAWRYNSYLMVAFVILIIFSSITESILMRRQGIMFVMLFVSLFYHHLGEK